MTAISIRRAGALAVAVLALVACGKRGSPVSPLVRVPEAVSDLSATARDNAIELAWTVPRRRIDRSRLFDPGVATLYRTDDSGTGEPRAAMRVKDRIPGYAEIASFPLSDLAEGRIVHIDRRDLAFGRRYTYVAMTRDAQGRMSPPSARTSVTYIAPPEAPGGLRAEPGDGQVRLAWQPPPRLVDGTPIAGPLVYEILRSPDAAAPPAGVARTAPGETSFVDRGLANDRSYHYAVRAIRTEAGAAAAGAASAPVTATPAKTTPPTPPTDLAAIASRGEVRLSWKPSAAADVASYVVYRAAPGGTFARVGSVRPPATTFVDRNVPPGRYRYSMTAQDSSTRPNESARSPEVTVTVP